MKVIATLASLAALPGALAYTSYNAPMAPGNENIRSENGFQAELEKGLPTINVQYRFNPAKTAPEASLAQVEEELAFSRRLADDARQFRHDAAQTAAIAAGVGAGSFLQKQAPPAGVRMESAAGHEYADLGEVMLGIAHAARPHRRPTTLIDPASAETVNSCDRDYSQTCPQGFSSSSGSCVATTYNGACRSEVQNFSAWTLAAKTRWQQQCGAFWSCKSCTRDYSQQCPQGFESTGSGCRATAAYDGPCRGEYNFSEWNASMLKNFSNACGAYWQCA